MKKFGNQVSVFLFEDYLILGLEKKWLEVFISILKHVLTFIIFWILFYLE